MDKREKHLLFITLAGVALFVGLNNLHRIKALGAFLASVFMPIIVGGIIALFLNVPVNGLQKRLRDMTAANPKKPSDAKLRMISFAIVVLLVALLILLIGIWVAPELVRSVRSLYDQANKKLPEWAAYLRSTDASYPWLGDLLSNVDPSQITQRLSTQLGAFLGSLFDVLSATLSTFVMAIFAIIIAAYMTLGKDGICRNSRRVLYAFAKPAHAKKIHEFCRLFSDSFARFLSGQCVEAVILGVLITVSFSLFGLPYAGLVGTLTAVCALIPYVGAFVSLSVAVFLTLLAEPNRVLACILVYIVVQFCENQFIYPRVVGGSVGLSPMYTLIAALIGGNLFGIMGILFFIPLAAVVVHMLSESVDKRLADKNLEV